MARKVLLSFLLALTLIISLFIISGCDKSSEDFNATSGSDETTEGSTAENTANTPEESSSENESIVCEHQTSQWVIDIAATCKNEGSRHRECESCAATLETAVISVIAHTEEIIVGKDATCLETGLTEGKICSVCQTVIVAQETIEKKPHTEKVLERVQATCENEGLTEGKACAVCNTVIIAQEITPKKNHTEVIIEGRAASCGEDGLTAGKKCSVCDTVIIAQETIPATDHIESNWIIDELPTTEKSGLMHTECTLCHIPMNEETISPITEDHEHSIFEWVVTTPATCKEEGTKQPICSCGHTFNETVSIPTVPHTEEIIHALSPSCTKTGLTEGKKCSVCGDIITAQEIVPTIPHTEEIIPGKTPTCTETGLTTGKKCSDCGLTLVAQSPISKADHTPVTVLGIKPTCEAGGTTDGTKCGVCSIELQAQLPLPPTGHSFENGICIGCGLNENMGVWIVDGLGNPVKDIIVKVMKGNELVKMFPYKGEFLPLNLPNDTYRLELDLSGLKGKYDYDHNASVITPENFTTTIRIFQKIDKSTADTLCVSSPIDKDYTAYHIAEGSYKITLAPNDYTFLIFSPQKAATYVFEYECESALSIGYHGGTFFTQGTDLSSDTGDFIKLETGLSASIYASNIGGSFVFSIYSDGATECILNLRNAGDPGTRIEDEPWTPYLEDEKLVNAQLNTNPQGEFTAIDLSDLTLTAVYNTADGYYHLGSENGAIIYIDLTTASPYIASIQTICANQRMGAYIYDDNGKLAEKRSYNELFMQYGMPGDSSPVDKAIRVPLTEKLAEAIKSFGTNNNWWKEGSESNIFTPVHKTEPYNSEYAWLLYCGIYQ